MSKIERAYAVKGLAPEWFTLKEYEAQQSREKKSKNENK